MAKLILGGQEYPLMMTVRVLADMEASGIGIQDIPKFFSPSQHPLAEAIHNGVSFLQGLLEAGQDSTAIRDGVDPKEVPSRETLERLLTPGQIWGLCDAAITDSLVRTVEAAPEKKRSAVKKSP